MRLIRKKEKNMRSTLRYWGLTVLLAWGLVACSSGGGDNGAGGAGGASGAGGSAGSGGVAGTAGDAGSGGAAGVGGTGGAGGAAGVGGIGGDAGAGGVGGVGAAGGSGGTPNDGLVIDYAGTVGPAGGVINAQVGRVVLAFSPGAVSEDTDIRVSPLSNVGVPGMVTPTTFDFGPDGAIFGAPVTLTLSYEQTDIPAGVDENELIMLASSHDAAEMVPVPGSVVDPVANTISATISGFSVHGMALPGCTLAGGPLPWCPPQCEIPAPTYPDDPGGDIDTSFGTDGRFSFELGSAGSTGIGDLLIDEQGRLLLGASEVRMAVVRVLPDGEGLDTTFGDNGVALAYTGGADSQGLSIAQRTDGRILLHGVRQPPGGGLNLLLARYMPDGTLDSSFGDEGLVLDLRQANTGSGRVVALPDGRVLVTDAGARSIYQFLPDGSPDPTFGAEGIAMDSGFVGIPTIRRATADWLLGLGTGVRVVDADGTAGLLYLNLGPGGTARRFEEIAGAQYVLGGSKQIGSGLSVTWDVWAARFRPGTDPGSLESDPCFAGNGASTYDFGRAELAVSSAVQSDGRIVIAGATSERNNDDDDLFVVRIRPDGEIDAGFGENGIVFLDFGGDEAGGSVAIDDQGRIVVAGSSRVGDPLFGDRFGVVARLSP